MANTSFKVENGLLVQGNAQFDYTSKFNANVTIEADQWYIGGDLYVTGTQVFVGGEVAAADILAGISGLKLGNSTYQWDGYLSNAYVYGTLLNPVGNTVLLGNSTNRWVISGNSLNISTTSTLTGAATLSNTIAVTGAATLSNTLAVTGTSTLTGNTTLSGTLQTISGNVVFNTGTLFVDATTSRVGIGTTTPDVTLKVQGSFTANGPTILANTSAHTGAATFANTIAVTGAATLANTLAVTGTTTFSNDVTINANLTVTGTRTYVNTQTLDIGDNIITLNADLPGATAPTENAGIEINRGSSANSRLQWNESTDTWQLSSASVSTFYNIVNEGTTNTNFDVGTLFVDAFNNRVGINNTAPLVALRVTGDIDISSTANVQGNANVAGLLGVAGGLAVTGTTNTSAQFNVGGGVATTNGATITNTSIRVGNSFVNTQISPSQIIIRTNATGNAYSQLLLASSDQVGGSLTLQHGNTTSNSTIVLGAQSGNNASIELGGSTASFIDFKTPSEDDFDTRLFSNTSGFNIIAGSSTSANIVNITSANVNIDAGTLFVDAVNNRVGINTTTPGASLNVVGNTLITGTVTATTGFISNNFVKAQKIVAPTPIINKGTGLLTSIGASISLTISFGNFEVDPTGRFLYVPATTTTVGQYSINQSTGALTSIAAAVAAENGVRGIAVDPTGRFVYVGNNTDSTISQYSINQSTGELTSIAAAVATGTSPQGLATDPTGRFVYVCAGSSVHQYSISQSTGELTLIGSVSSSLAYSIAVDPTGRFVYVVANNSTGSISVYSINQSTGALTIVGSSTSISNSPIFLAIDPSGRFVYVTRETGNLVSQFSIDQNTGAVTLIGAVATGNSPQRIAISPNGLYAYITNATDSTIQQYSINQYTGVLASLGTVSVTSARAITTDSTGRFVYAASTSELYSFSVNNLSAGSITIAGLLRVSNSSSTANLSPSTLTIGTTTVNNSLVNAAAINVVNQTNTATLFVTTSANVGTALTINSTQLAVTPNANFDSGVLFVDAVTNRVGINTTAPVQAFEAILGSTGIASFADIAGNGRLWLAGNSVGSYVFNRDNSPLIFGTANTNRLSIDNIGVLTHAAGANATFDSGTLFVDATTNRVGINNSAPLVALRVTGDIDISSTANVQGNANVGGTLGVSGVVTLSSNTFIGKTAADAGATAGIELRSSGTGLFTRAAETVAFFNRLTDDGPILVFRQAGTDEGNISVAGTTITLNSFCGAHWAQLSDNSRPTILRGTVVETIDEMCEWENEDNDQLTKFKISDTVASKSVYGVFQTWDTSDYVNNDANIASLGAYIIRIAAGVTVSKGDLLESAGNGCARVQSDDIIRSSTIGKVTNGSYVIETYPDGSYLVPCVLYCG